MLFPRLIGGFFKHLLYASFFSFNSFPSSVHQPLIGPKTLSVSRRPLSGPLEDTIVPQDFTMQMACNWPTAVSGQFKGSFPGPATLHIRALRRSSEPPREERAAWWIGGPHTLRTAPRICVFSARNFGFGPSIDLFEIQRNCPFYINIDSIVNHNYMKNWYTKNNYINIIIILIIWL